jgi:hypothetical protein
LRKRRGRDHTKEKEYVRNESLIAYDSKITREELARVPTPPATATHQPIPHHQIVEALVESLSFRQIGVIQEEFAVAKDGMKNVRSA